MTIVGEDGRPRCAWCAADPEYRRYHDEEWGVPLHGDQKLFEKISLEGFQAGLSWISILRRRPAFRRAFHDFDPTTVAAMTDDDQAELLADPGIIRNRAKIAATVSNAQAVVEMCRDNPGALDELVWSFAPSAARSRPRSSGDLVATTPESKALSRELKSRGFRFVGPTTMHALMQAAGLVDDHVTGCWRVREESHDEIDLALTPGFEPHAHSVRP